MARVTRLGSSVPVDGITASVYRVPTDGPEADGTIAWSSTTMVLVEARAAGVTGIGFSYTGAGAASVIRDLLAEVVAGSDAMAVPGVWEAMRHAVRNVGRPGLVSSAIAAVDVALWDLKARLLDLPLLGLLGAVRSGVPVYGSGGFTTYSDARLREQLGGWAEAGFPAVKMKVGTNPADDLARARTARDAIGAGVQLYTDANGAYSRKQALAFAEKFGELGVTWFEEPVSSDDLEGLRLMRDHAPAGMDIAAGEYGYDLFYFRRMLDAGAVDCLQADATRCAGITEFLRVGALCAARSLPLSAHTAPTVHMHPCCALANARNVEYFYDHARIERMFFDGAIEPVGGVLHPDPSRPGLGIELKRADVERYAIR